VDLNAGSEHCAVFWLQEKKPSHPQVLYADAGVLDYSEKPSAAGLTVEVHGRPDASARLIVFKPARNDVENRAITLDAQGRATLTFDPTTLSPK
ncbi:MAG: hypothetical protein NTV46_06550, partial [Verrucomicrobia bacterium]|nr:hypothetical protein [Verrucomicrobiota bacterium]